LLKPVNIISEIVCLYYTAHFPPLQWLSTVVFGKEIRDFQLFSGISIGYFSDRTNFLLLRDNYKVTESSAPTTL